MKALKYLLWILLCLLILVPVLVIDLSPQISVASGEQVNKADTVNTLLQQMRGVFRERDVTHQITVTEAQAQSLAGFIQRAHTKAHVDAAFDQDSAQFQLSYYLGHLFTDFYLNVEVDLSSGSGIELNRVKVGDLSLPGAVALPLMSFVVNQYTKTDVATVAQQWVKSVTISKDELSIDLAESAPLFDQLKRIDTGSDESTYAFRMRVGHYVRMLEALPYPTQSKPSLSYYLRAAMMEARTQSKNSNPALENEAAILALAIFTGSYRFAHLVGDIGISIKAMPTAPEAPTLSTRMDLSLHFIFSAAIKLLSEQGFSLAVGEFKELMDRGPNGSGYSFRDLAADMAGAHFAALAVDPNRAREVQQIIINNQDEAIFFPKTDGLDEGLDTKAFVSKYQAVDSPIYQQTVQLIQSRIEALPISQ
ncbi:hypothetical protein PN836_009270 [Ningiella sp. W23]|uniref:hypothetical protein n=1 Tax=Ningiella sp. W23 TaxID=3023715 RepID=UPI0037584216